MFLLTICAFFGHRDTPITNFLTVKLEETIKRLINQGINEFWCCEQGNFDWIARSTVLRLKKEFPHIKVCYILAYCTLLNTEISQNYLEDTYDDIIYPEIAEKGHPKFAITRRNQYIVENADIVVCYVIRQSGGAFEAFKTAEKLKKKIINLA